ncbi:MAG: prolipoprotein diacylglyceryl transferase [Gammaproteobacteria bacterium]|nr:prolipoprotein diacylglyceryl transferase [Gammaproteobacteria bacterium]
MLIYPDIDPVALALGPVTIHWYGLMYLLAFSMAWGIARYRGRAVVNRPWSDDEVSDLIFYGALGVVLGGRFGYVIFYNFDRFLGDPLWLFKVWEGGMAFHGGFLGVWVALIIFSRRHKRHIFDVMDFVAPIVPLGLAAGRLGNFIGGELWGRAVASDVPWAMVFSHVDNVPRHPSQLYQMSLEGILLFIIVFWFSSKPRPRLAVSGLWIFCYGCFRFILEFFRQPDAHLNYVAFDWLTMGQALSLPMVLLGLGAVIWAYRQKEEKSVK